MNHGAESTLVLLVVIKLVAVFNKAMQKFVMMGIKLFLWISSSSLMDSVTVTQNGHK